MAQKPFFVLPTPLGTVTTGNERANRPARFLGEFNYKGMVWETNGGSNAWVRCDLGASKDIDFVSMMNAAADPSTTIRVRVGATQAAVDGGSASYDSGVVPFINPAISRDDGRYHSHLELPSVQNKRWVRVDIGGLTGDFLASMLVIGKKLNPTYYYEPRWNRDIRDLGSVSFSRNGVPGVNYGAKLRAIAFKLAWITEQEMEELFSPFDEATAKTTPFFICFDPEATSYRQRRTFFGFNEEQPSLSKLRFNTFERSFQFLSLF